MLWPYIRSPTPPFLENSWWVIQELLRASKRGLSERLNAWLSHALLVPSIVCCFQLSVVISWIDQLVRKRRLFRSPCAVGSFIIHPIYRNISMVTHCNYPQVSYFNELCWLCLQMWCDSNLCRFPCANSIGPGCIVISCVMKANSVCKIVHVYVSYFECFLVALSIRFCF